MKCFGSAEGARLLYLLIYSLQVVNELVFDRLDIFNRNMEKFKEMLKSVEVSDCCCSAFFDYSQQEYWENEEFGLVGVEKVEKFIQEICSWPVFHSDIREMMVKSMYRGVAVGCMGEEGTQTRVGVAQSQRVAVLDVGKVVDIVTNRASTVLTFLHTGLSSIYSGTDIAQIESIRRLLDFKFFTEAVERSGASNTATVHFRGWVDAAKLLQPDLLIRISAEELRSQFRRFMAKLEELAPTLNKLENLKIFSLFLDPSLHHYTDIQSVLAIMANASVAMGLESVVESWVSVMEHHNSSVRSLTQDRLEQECMVAINGPVEVQCDSVVQEALASYWGRQSMVANRAGHWVRRSEDIRHYAISEAVDTIVNKPPSVPFMAE